MKNVLCRHCINSCKRIGLINCNSYNAKSNKPEQLRAKINEAYKKGDYELGRKLSEELFRLENG